MNDDLPNTMPPRLPPVVTRVPRVFNIWGTLVYAVCSFTAFVFMLAKPWWTPPWWVLLPTFAYVFVSTGIIAMGRIESNKNAQAFINMLKHQSEINKRSMN